MTEFAPLFRDIITGYLQFLQEGGDPVHLEPKPRRHLDGGYVHCSALFDCPKYESEARRNVPAKFPHLLNVNQPTALLRMLQGNKVAEIFQESLVWKAEQGHISAWVEDYFLNEPLRLQGQIDAWMSAPERIGFDVIEFKHRLPGWKDKGIAQPRLGDVFQLFAYMHDNNPQGTNPRMDNGHLVIVDTPAWKNYLDPEAGYEVWSLVPHGEGYQLVSERGYTWDHPFNNGDFINDETLKGEIQRHLNYMENTELPPPVNLADPAEAWRCRDVKYYPKNGNPGVMTPRCAYWCHTEEVPEEGLKYLVNGNDEVEFVWEF